MSEVNTPHAATALLENTRDPSTPARLYRHPCGEVIARRPADVLPALQALTQHSQSGLHACGYIAYEAGYGLNQLPLPDFFEPDTVLLHFVLFPEVELLDAAATEAWLQSQPGARDAVAIHDLELAEDEANYTHKIRQIHGLIEAGDTYQINYTLPCRFRHAGSALALYRALRREQRVAFSAWLDFPELQALSLSPELFLQRQGSLLTTRPMKGTAARGGSAAEDAALAEHLRSDPKSRAENLMIVDLLRNDIGRVARTGSVRVPSLFDVECYETVQQMTSTVTGELDFNTDLAVILAALFPCGSITGAPKRHTMQLIAELEQEPRGLYTGALGYIEPNGDFCFNVPIRTVVSTQPQRALMGVGSGIVHDSNAHAEYAEVQLKTRFLHGVNRDLGLIESMHLSPDGSIRHQDLHLARLRKAAAAFGFYVPERALQAELAAYTLHHPQTEARRLRLQLNSDGTFSLADFAIPAVPAHPTVCLSTQRIDADSILRRHKTTQRHLYEDEYAHAASAGHYEVLFLNQHGRVAEAARHNVFIRRGEQLLTPPVSEGALPGILRQHLGDNVHEDVLTLDDLRTADAIYVGNAVRGLSEVFLAP